MNNRISVATIDSPEFINLEPLDINPLMSKCDIKVLYVGQNRNRSVISKEVAIEMSKTLRGCPIVGYYIDKKEDFGDHGDQVIIDSEGVKFNKLTKPYGFVAPDAEVWFQYFNDVDEAGRTIKREYLMTTGYLWTGQFEECKRVLKNNNPQSMELDEETLDGNWSTDDNTGIDFFIINDAVFSKLCILGDDVEPCFEGANISSPTLSSQFSKDDSFTKSLFSMMKELKFALQNNKGGKVMDGELQNDEVKLEENSSETPDEKEGVEKTPVSQVNEETEKSVDSEEVILDNEEEAPAENDSSEPAASVENDSAAEEAPESSFKKKEKEDEKKDKDDKSDTEKTEENIEDEDNSKEEKDKKDKDEDDKKKKKYSLENELSELQNKFAELKAENEKLLVFKQEVENKEKDELIASFYMLSDEDKKNVIENKANYSLREIKAELSMICVDKKVDFSLNNEEDAEKAPMTYNLDSHQAELNDLPAWLKPVQELKNQK